MKITQVEILPANRFLYVRVTTDEGISGIGESGAWGFLDASAEAMQTFKQYLIGKNPLHIEHHWQYLYRSFHFRGAAIMGAISAIDIALWDIAGKWFDAPIHTLLGGESRRKVRAYYHVSGETTEELIDECLKAKSQGYTAVGHLSPFLDEPRNKPYFMTYAQLINEATDRVAKLREAVGDEVDLCLELHRRMKPGEAIAFAQSVEPYRPFFLEDPIPADNFDAMGLVASKTTVPIATGERIHTIQEFQMLLSRKAMSYARTSVCLCGGISGARKIAAIAESHGVAIVPHNPLSPVSSVACLQLSVAVDNFAVMELPDHETVSATERYTSDEAVDPSSFKQSDMVTWVPKAESGFIPALRYPGLGIALVEDVCERFPYRRREVNTRLHVDGSVVDQ
ncbi:mandelate racemase/muconate lactonizing enzyme family protein [Salinicola corii]|uniref:Mandelate racemase/muconate lactonizing enzyme family protein n=1 Tax=Salinicola corii TaxID=2606937 RepID=A0A640WE44_9GAMM|nr:mandelate racemase/muconate lactonizing enzyme family protein [Salinicola corii]KAA0018219.1 mandelate racemase/muconate lactonizing enzyme family protein [Salinicola corii]